METICGSLTVIFIPPPLSSVGGFKIPRDRLGGGRGRAALALVTSYLTYTTVGLFWSRGGVVKRWPILGHVVFERPLKREGHNLPGRPVLPGGGEAPCSFDSGGGSLVSTAQKNQNPESGAT